MKALIIGFGSIGKKHFLALKNLGFDISLLSFSACKKDVKETKLYNSWDELSLMEFDLFIIANITTLHLETLKKIDTFVKDKIILVEKPLFEKFIPFQSNKNKIFIAYLLRFNPLIKALKEILQVEKPYFVELSCHSYLPNWRDIDYRENYSAKKELGGGVLLDLSHEIDLAFFLFGKLKLLYSENLKLSELEIDSDDFAFLSLKNSKDLKIHIKLDYFSKLTQRKIIIHTPKKSYEADLIQGILKIYNEDKSIKTQIYKSDTILTLESMHKAILNNDKNLCSLDEALDVLKICDEVKNG
ncbi:Gfo/Idh/MocA family protein [Campylobacter sp. TTU_617]|uniref:Gfo/Idh/MocA family protein n=2 Tax=unclassified Campylobacter TaxID=2593542 RepID=UPI00190766CF|nr:Gfo/Idh/MocA family oxidoreductase [Campylobacter sp. TTU_617]MBK1972284.1 Gfo/Idh/MocA family oxidoreductase [Campylobacter sp. TTU_617]